MMSEMRHRFVASYHGCRIFFLRWRQCRKHDILCARV